MLQTAAPITSLDLAIIADGQRRGWVTTHHTARADDPDMLGIAWLRFRAACARAELAEATDPEMRRYLKARASLADGEATARAASPPARAA
jgi:hypothetical protein